MFREPFRIAAPVFGRPLQIEGRPERKYERVRVLLQSAGAAQIGRAWPLVLPPFRPTVELRQEQDRHLQMFGERQGAAGGFPYIALLIAVAADRPELVGVVDNREARPDALPNEGIDAPLGRRRHVRD